MECFKCGATKDKAILFEVITPQGIATICNNCYKGENFPIIEKHDFKEYNPKSTRTVRERLISNSNRDTIEKKTFEENKEILKKNLELKKIVNENYLKDLDNIKPREDLIRNFHWVIMRERRKKHLTQKQFAEILGEPEIAIKAIESGVAGEGAEALIKKIESFFDINLFKRKKLEFEEEKEKIEMPKEIDEFSIDEMKEKNYTVGELKEMSKNKIKKPFWKSWIKGKEEDETENIENLNVEPPSSEEKSELSDEEIDKILFGE